MVVAVIIIGIAVFQWKRSAEGFRSTKCFSCEAQDQAMGIVRSHGTKCFSCEAQSTLAHPNKCFSCEREKMI